MTEITRDAIRDSDMARLPEILECANLPSLLMVLYHMTGEEKWLRAPYLPSRPRGMNDNDSGGFPDDIQAEIRSAAQRAIIAWARGRDLAVPVPRADELRRMMAVCAGESEIPDNYVAMMGEELGFSPLPGPTNFRDHPDRLRPGFRVAVIGAGIGGLLTAYRLKEAGIPYVVFEMNDDVGGTWLRHRYPGAGVDTPSYLYSFSFFQRDWSRYFPKQSELLDYIRDFAEHFDLRQSIRFNTKVKSACYDEKLQIWRLEYEDREGRRGTFKASAVVSAVGLFGKADIPAIAGMESFRGQIFHSTEWPTDLDLRGKRVAVVGSGATAMQVVPAIAPQVQSLTIFQKSPMWVAPSEQYFKKVPDTVHWLLNHIPFYRHWYRFQLAWIWNDRIYPSLIRDPEWEHGDRSMNSRNDRHREYFTDYITTRLADRPELIVKAVPHYPPFAKRMLVDNGWYDALLLPHVDLLDEKLVRLTEHTAVGEGGTERDVDVIALCTGYQTSRFLASMEIRGRNGRSLREEWHDDDARAYLGITVPGYPNFFMIYGPNTNGAGGSYFSFAEAQVTYILQMIDWLARGDVGSVEPRVEPFLEYNRRMDGELARMVWAHPGVDSYYRNARGRITVNRPWSVVDYWTMIRHAKFEDFDVEPVADYRVNAS